MRLALRVAAFLISLALVAMWFAFLRAAFASSTGGVPAPGAFVVTLIFSGIALAGGVGALRDVPVAVALTGLVSMLPVGLYLMVFPGPTRWIGVLDAALLMIGITLLRQGDPEEAVEGTDGFSSPPPRSPGSGRPPSP